MPPPKKKTKVGCIGLVLAYSFSTFFPCFITFRLSKQSCLRTLVDLYPKSFSGPPPKGILLAMLEPKEPLFLDDELHPHRGGSQNRRWEFFWNRLTQSLSNTLLNTSKILPNQIIV